MDVPQYYSQWLDEALNFDIYHASDAPQVSELRDLLYLDVAPMANIRQSPDRTKDALRLVLLNLYVGWQSGRPTMYSRNSRDYRHHERYGKLYVKIKRLLPIIDALLAIGYAHGEKGYNCPNDKKRSRVWASARLIGLFQMFEMDGPGFIYHEQPQEIIQLKDSTKVLIDYEDTPATDGMRARLQAYNEFIGQQKVEVLLNQDSEVSGKFARSLITGEVSGVVKLNAVDIINNGMCGAGIKNTNVSRIDNSIVADSNSTITITNTINKIDGYSYPTPYTIINIGQCIACHPVLAGHHSTKRIKKEEDRKVKLSKFGVSNLIFTIHYMYRDSIHLTLPPLAG